MQTRDSVYPLCRHTKADGLRCQSPALTTSAFCHYHQRQRRTRPSTIVVPALGKRCFHPLQDRHSIFHSYALIVQGLASGRLDPKQAGRMIHALDLALNDLKRTSME
jgi:hypothetical protein